MRKRVALRPRQPTAPSARSPARPLRGDQSADPHHTRYASRPNARTPSAAPPRGSHGDAPPPRRDLVPPTSTSPSTPLAAAGLPWLRGAGRAPPFPASYWLSGLRSARGLAAARGGGGRAQARCCYCSVVRPRGSATGGDPCPRGAAMPVSNAGPGHGLVGRAGSGMGLGMPRAASRTLGFSLTGAAARGDLWGGAGPGRGLRMTARCSVPPHCGICPVLGVGVGGCGIPPPPSWEQRAAASVTASAEGPGGSGGEELGERFVPC